ncbi:DUF4112 domain-containing protein [Gloeocapsopsis crepidinum LEGE 06123]|uniref:DUF4112 domain-containing protein n=1 Tax=Gloeocapsopsis crepidinum LEGE 06123 TaxID=588587 RepID=A0ABR9UPV4_9CHRO|nr:DUF4112 domain-containing protein [Gloeocapsopsis crepidinum]MBE9190306.1 DUF4112 domain-containing protein [Gloeocapsopsis crepidinum LEGE 06123]
MTQSATQFANKVAAHSKLTSVQRLRRFSRLLDNAIGIPGTKFRIGIDPIIGLIPGAGDIVGTALSAYIVVEAARLGIPKAILGRMVRNIVIESVFGSVPIIGDMFDFAWKANMKNVDLLEEYLKNPQKGVK